MEDKYTLTQHYYVVSDYDKALELLNEIENSCDQFGLFFTRASCYIKMKEFKKAIDELGKAEKIKTSGEVSYKKGVAYFNLCDYINSHVEFKKALLASTSNEQREKLSLWKNKLDIEIEENNIILTENIENKEVTGIKIIHNWYQTANNITLTLDSNVEFTKDELAISIEKKAIKVLYKSDLIFDITLSNSVIPNSCSYEVNKKRIVFNLKKEVEGFNWVTLDANKVQQAESSFVPSYPTSNRNKKDWTQIDKEIEKELNKDVSGEEGLMKMFKEIYERGDENTRRAMMKSMQTSSGTVLSTNWDEVAQKDYEGKDRPDAPKGQEWADK
jgi:tetratricopeptide (TPR) repeat protein